jgi:hypothetical protein
MAALKNKRHHSACPLYSTEKHPRLFYYEEAIDAWTPAPDMIENILSCDRLDNGEDMEISFKRVDMTDEEYDAIPED